MPVKSLELFSGGPDQDIHGRAVDGGGVTGLDEGTWDKVENSPGAGTFDIVKAPFLGAAAREVALNAASIPNIDLIASRQPGDLLGLLVYSSNIARSSAAPSGWTEINRSSLAGDLAFYARECDGSEADTVTVTFTGGGAAGTEQHAFSFGVRGNITSPIGEVGPNSSWLSANNLGPISGITPDAADSLVLLFGAKQNDFNVTPAASPTASGWTLARDSDQTAGNDSATALFWQLLSGTPTVSDATIADTGQPGAGTGFMVEVKMGGDVPGGVAHKGSATLEDWNHYVVKDIPNVGDSFGDYMVEAEFVINNLEDSTFIAVLARHDDTLETGYELNAVPVDGGMLSIRLYHIWDDFYTEEREILNYSGVDWRSGPVRLKLCVSGPSFAVDIKAYIGTNDDDMVRVIPDDGTLDPLGNFIHTPPSGEEIEGGWPGLCMHDHTPGGGGTAHYCTMWRASDTCDLVPCTGGPENPYPENPPPIPPPPEASEFPWERGGFRYPTSPSSAHTLGRFRTPSVSEGIARKAVWERGAWREILTFDGETIPEPNTPEPPYHDPCYIVPPIDPGPLDPITGRFFGMSNTPMGAVGGLFTGNQKALGNWYTSDLPFAASRGCVMVGGPGGGDRIKLNGNRWDYDFFLDAWRGIFTPLYSTLLTYTSSGFFFGASIADDVTSESLWGPGGVDMTEFASAVGVLHSEFPGIRLGSRMRPSQAPFDIGLDFYFCQYSAERGSASSFAATEYTICLARSAYLIVCINYLHGGDGSSGVRYANGTHKGQSAWNWMCSPTEVVTYFDEQLDAIEAIDSSAALVAGGLGYQYLPEFLELDDGTYTMIEALSIAHNRFAALTPP